MKVGQLIRVLERIPKETDVFLTVGAQRSDRLIKVESSQTPLPPVCLLISETSLKKWTK